MSEYLEWEVQKRGSSRSCSFAAKDMKGALERDGCVVEQHPVLSFLFIVRRFLQPGEEPRQVRREITFTIRRVHPEATKVFKGIHHECRR